MTYSVFCGTWDVKPYSINLKLVLLTLEPFLLTLLVKWNLKPVWAVAVQYPVPKIRNPASHYYTLR